MCLSILIPAVLAVLPSCRPSVYTDVYPTLVDRRYDSEFPYRGCSEQLEQIGETVKMMSCIAYYRVYPFAESDRVRTTDVTATLLEENRDAYYINSSTSGTATVVLAQGRNVALLTCAHTVAFPETVFSFHPGADRKPGPFLKSVSVKEKQTNFVAVLPERGDLEILAIDKSADIALMGKTFATEPVPPIQVFRYPFGAARELEWGSFVYLFGYPSGYKMVTKGIVSSPRKDRFGTFLIDAVFNRGFSGGIALAIRDGVPNFELVGMVKLVTAHTSYVLVPEKDDGVLDYDPTLAYSGKVFVERKTEIEYGVTQAISVESIREFLVTFRGALEARGYFFPEAMRER